MLPAPMTHGGSSWGITQPLHTPASGGVVRKLFWYWGATKVGFSICMAIKSSRVSPASWKPTGSINARSRHFHFPFAAAETQGSPSDYCALECTERLFSALAIVFCVCSLRHCSCALSRRLFVSSSETAFDGLRRDGETSPHRSILFICRAVFRYLRTLSTPA